MPEGKLVGSASMTTVGLFPWFVSNKCDRAVLSSQVGKSQFVTQEFGGSTIIYKLWLWDPHEGRPRPLLGKQTDPIGVGANEDSQSAVLIEKDNQGASTVRRVDLRSRREFARSVNLGVYWYANPHWTDGGYILVGTYAPPDAAGFMEEKFTVVRSSDLQEPPFVKDQYLIRCQGALPDNHSPTYLLGSVPGGAGFIWQVGATDPLPLHGIDSTDVRQCVISPDGSRFVLLKKNESAELWSLNGNRLADFRVGGAIGDVGWSLQGTSVRLMKETGEIMLFSKDGVPQAILPSPGIQENYSEMEVDSGSGLDVSFRPSCDHIIVWTAKGRVVKYTKKLKVFGLPYLIPTGWHLSDSGCAN
jgi:hypothetical protein